MNEFIVWDDIKKEFVSDVQSFISFNCDGTINCFNGFGETNYFPYIGKTDINDKKIYADCSIFEFKYNNASAKLSLKGYFKLNDNIALGCSIKLIDCALWSELSYSKESFRFINFKIIDTIQENKLGLIKE